MRVPGSCGELVQGIYQGEPYLITCPIKAYTEVTISDSWQGAEGLGEKSLRALRLTLEYLGQREFPYGIKLTGSLPRGKGMASSSADIGAVCAAVAASLGRNLLPEEIMGIAVGIEPTDPVFFSGHVCVNQLKGRIYTRYESFPHLKIAVFDTGGTVDTIVFHSENVKVEAEMPPPAFLSIPTERELAEAATISALANQSKLLKPCLEELLTMAREKGALGLNAAHSGTVLGVLWPSDMSWEKLEKYSRELSEALPKLAFMTLTELIPGGISYEMLS